MGISNSNTSKYGVGEWNHRSKREGNSKSEIKRANDFKTEKDEKQQQVRRQKLDGKQHESKNLGKGGKRQGDRTLNALKQYELQQRKLISMIEAGDLREIKRLINRKADVNRTLSRGDKKGRTILVLAVGTGRVEIVNYLLRAKARVNYSNPMKNESNPLAVASSMGNLDMINCLIKHSADVNCKSSRVDSSPLQEAIDRLDNYGPREISDESRERQIAVVNLLLDKKADIDFRDDGGWTALVWATRYGHTLLMRLLISRRANLEAETISGATPLHFAARNESLESIKILLEEKANVNHRNRNGMNALMSCFNSAYRGQSTVVRTESIPVVNQLIEYKCNVNCRDLYGANVLFYSLTSVKMTKLLIDTKASPLVLNNKGESLLHVATRKVHNIEENDLEILRIILDAKVDINLTDKKGWTVLHHAAGRRKPNKSIKFLLNNGADVLARTNDGTTPEQIIIANDKRGMYYDHHSKHNFPAQAWKALQEARCIRAIPPIIQRDLPRLSMLQTEIINAIKSRFGLEDEESPSKLIPIRTPNNFSWRVVMTPQAANTQKKRAQSNPGNHETQRRRMMLVQERRRAWLQMMDDPDSMECTRDEARAFDTPRYQFLPSSSGYDLDGKGLLPRYTPPPINGIEDDNDEKKIESKNDDDGYDEKMGYRLDKLPPF
eukprot:CAMPEP_0114497030 /NCGR_PEP_ID=MMETSP0109-20121206/6092_1 /TAXON_ID=29199 /ORGANISM="Chlorarachnion reptans, Strain CCCM449" /LENGTH=666 /DNA_ID=CAMNT_0001674355 /DNA_START=158 /DNA_END=2158 /DNA_ORIENTATION=-